VFRAVKLYESFFWLALVALALCFFLPKAAWAQNSPKVVPLSAKDVSLLLQIASEPVNAALENRAPRAPQEPSATSQLNKSYRMVVSVNLDNKLLARAWELREPGPLQATALSLGQRVISEPDIGRPLNPDEYDRAKFSLAIIFNLRIIDDEKQASAAEALIVLSGFNYAVGLPRDLRSGSTTFELFSKACELSGLSPTAWLGNRATLYAGQVEEFSR
jgi:hypothetical protein